MHIHSTPLIGDGGSGWAHADLIDETGKVIAGLIVSEFDPEAQRNIDHIVRAVNAAAKPLLLGHAATPEWIDAVNKHHEATDQIVVRQTGQLGLLRADLAVAREALQQIADTCEKPSKVWTIANNALQYFEPEFNVGAVSTEIETPPTMKSVPIEAGYRMLALGEAFRADDLVWSYGYGPWIRFDATPGGRTALMLGGVVVHTTNAVIRKI